MLGICRCGQMINLVRGNSLFFDISEISDRAPCGRILFPKKTINLAGGSRLAGNMRCNPCWANAVRHQAVREPDDGLKIVARDEHDIVQAIEAPEDRFTVGVQWHPVTLPFLCPHMSLFNALVAEVGKPDSAAVHFG